MVTGVARSASAKTSASASSSAASPTAAPAAAHSTYEIWRGDSRCRASRSCSERARPAGSVPSWRPAWLIPAASMIPCKTSPPSSAAAIGRSKIAATPSPGIQPEASAENAPYAREAESPRPASSSR
jgi:hypothetical protein